MNYLHDKLRYMMEIFSSPVIYFHRENEKWYYLDSHSFAEGNKESVLEYCKNVIGIDPEDLSKSIYLIDKGTYDSASFGLISKIFIYNFSIF